MPSLHANLSDEAYDAWRRFALTNSVTMSGLVEAIGLELEALKRTSVFSDKVLPDASRIDAERRNRRL